MCYFFFFDMIIACELRWGVASIGVYSTGHCSPHRGTSFQVQEVCRETTFTRGRHCEESRVVALVLTFVKYYNKLVLIYVMYKSVVINSYGLL